MKVEQVATTKFLLNIVISTHYYSNTQSADTHSYVVVQVQPHAFLTSALD